MNLFHSLPPNEMMGERTGFITRDLGESGRSFMVVVPIPGRRNEFSDYEMAIIRNAKRTGWVGVSFCRGYRPRFRKGIEVIGNYANTGRTVRVYEAVK